MKKTYSEIERSLELLLTQYQKINLLKFFSQTTENKKKLIQLQQESQKLINECIAKWNEGLEELMSYKGIHLHELQKLCEPKNSIEIHELYKMEYTIKELYYVLHKRKASNRDLMFAKKTIEQGLMRAKHQKELPGRANWRYV